MPDYRCHYCGERCAMMGHKWCQQGVTRDQYYESLRPAETFIRVGSRLCTKDGRKVGNGIVTGIQDDIFLVETDFGNKMRLNHKELTDYYHVARPISTVEQWRDDKRSLSSEVEQRIVDAPVAGSIPAVTAI